MPLHVLGRPDALAAVLSLPQKLNVLVISPLDAMLSPLALSAAHEAYQFATSVGGPRLTVKAEVAAQDVLSTITSWLKSE